jgi:hypothetical protein
MIVEMNPQDENGLDNSPDNGRDIDINSDFCPEPGIGHGFDTGLISDFEYVPRGAELRAELSRISSKASELESLNYLSDPKDSYARYRRARLQTTLSSELNKLQRYKAYFDKEVARCDRNRVRIHADSEKIHLDETREYYHQAESLQQKQYREAVSDRDAVSWAISRVQAALRSSRGVGFGVGEPFGPDLPIWPLSGYQNDSGRLGNEVDGLLEFGPLGGQRQR